MQIIDCRKQFVTIYKNNKENQANQQLDYKKFIEMHANQ